MVHDTSSKIFLFSLPVYQTIHDHGLAPCLPPHTSQFCYVGHVSSSFLLPYSESFLLPRTAYFHSHIFFSLEILLLFPSADPLFLLTSSHVESLLSHHGCKNS